MWATEPHEGITGVTFDSDGHRLVGVLYLARGEEPAPTVVLLHGCPGLEKNLDLAVRLREAGWNSLVFHYRGCWGSAGRYDLRTIPRDVTAAVDFLAGCPHVDSGRIAVLGHSLGGWAAIVTAAAVTMPIWYRPAPSVDHWYASPSSRSAVRFMCTMWSTSGPMPPIVPKMVCTNTGGRTSP